MMDEPWFKILIAIFGLLLLNNVCLCHAGTQRIGKSFESNVNFISLKQDGEEAEIATILDLLKQGDQKIQLGPYTEAVLVLGNSGSGKTTFTQFVAGDNTNLISKEVAAGTGEYIIVDTNDKISDNSTITSKTIFPEVVVDEYSSMAYYDCPGFSDTRSPAYDIAATYFTKRVVDVLDKIKLVFVVNYSSLRQGVDRYDFMALVKHAVSMVKNIHKFNESIALVASKVDNQYVKQGKDFVLVSDEKVVESIATFVSNVRDELEVKINTPISNDDWKFYQNAVDFINALLIKENGKYVKIGIFRRPDEPGVVSKIDLLQQCKKNLKRITEGNIDFASKENDDFGYTISAESKNYVGGLMNAISRNVLTSISGIGNQIRKHYDNIENENKDLRGLQQQFKAGYQVLSGITASNFTVPSQFIDQLIKDLDVLDIHISKSNILHVLNADQYMKFFKAVAGQEIPDSMQWLQGFTAIVDYLNDSQKWYSFVINLYSMLSEFYVQEDINRYDIRNLKYQISLKNQQTVKVNETDLKNLVDQINPNNYDTGYDSIEHLKLNKIKADLLSEILDITLRHKVTSTCPTPNKLVVQGQFILLSEVNNMSKTCGGDVNVIQIFALNKIFIHEDFDKTGEKVELSIIAPTWSILGTVKIKLDGKPGESHKQKKADDGTWPGGAGKDGKPGLPGGSAGNFLGIGADFTNMKYLSIFANGGKGGAGQDGGTGGTGKDGEDPPIPENGKDEAWDKNRFKVEEIEKQENVEEGFSLVSTTFRVTGKTGSGGKGGNGGASGFGGLSGDVSLINLKDNSRPSISSVSGEEGDGGKGGEGGKGGKGGIVLVIQKSLWITLFKTFIQYRIISKTPSSDGESGEKGMDKYANNEIQAPENTQILVASYIINDFKNYLRENLAVSIMEPSLRQFVSQLDSNDEVVNLYDTLGLINELQGLEEQFYKLYRQTSLLPFYRSLMNKTEQYAGNPKDYEKSAQYKKVLSFLYTAALSKISGINNDLETNLVIDIKQYLNLVLYNINKLKELTNIVAINEYHKDYKQAIHFKTNEALNFIATDVTPTINSLFGEVDNNVQRLINETLDLQNQTNIEKDKLLQKENEMKRALQTNVFLGIIKVITQLLNFAGPVGAAVASSAGGGITIAESLFISDDDTGAEKLFAIPAAVKQSLVEIKTAIKYKQESLKEQLEVVEAELKKFLDNEKSDSIERIRREMAEAKRKLEEEMAKEASLDPASVNSMHETRKKLTDFLQKEKKELQKEKESNGRDVTKQLKLVGHVDNIIKIGDMSTKLYNSIKEDQAKLDQVGKNLKAIDEKIRKLKQYEETIYNTLIPTLKSVEESATKLEKDLKGKSHVDLDIKKWQMQSMMKDIKLQMNKLTKGFEIQEDLVRCIEKVEEGMTVMIDIYDRIEDYTDKTQLADYIANINSPKAVGIQVNNSTMEEAVDKLNLIIKSNLVVGQYEKAMTAFKQYIFPFARYYLQEYRLPPTLKPSNSIDDLVFAAISVIEDTRTKILESSILINKYDKYVHKDRQFTSRKPYSSPFITWSYENNKNTISKLLEGEEITIKADVTKGINKNAIRFKEIGIRLSSSNETIQNELDEHLKNFELTIVHLGNSYYRCGNNFYIITSENQTISYYLERDSNGNPIDKNEVYTKIRNNDALLSPYTLWSIKLKNLKGQNMLKQYKNQQIDLELEGYGQYIDQDIDVCNQNLQEYYDYDASISEISNIDVENQRGLLQMMGQGYGQYIDQAIDVYNQNVQEYYDYDASISEIGNIDVDNQRGLPQVIRNSYRRKRRDLISTSDHL